MIKQPEPLLTEPQRLSIYPIKHHDIYNLYRQMCAATWFPQEIDLSDDAKDYKSLTPNEQHFVKHILGFFSVTDFIVNTNLLENFMRIFTQPEMQLAYSAQMFIECIHAESYSLMIETIIDNREEKKKLFNSIEHFPCIRKKCDWAFKYIKSDVSIALKLVSFAIIEGVYFSGAFAAIYWLKDQNKLPGICSFNEFISRDEAMHVQLAVMLFKKLINIPTQQEISDIFTEAIDIEIEFITKSLPCKLLGLNQDDMITYIKYISDDLIKKLGFKGLYNVDKQPFSFMDKISYNLKANFFEFRPTQYQMAINDQGDINNYDNLSDDF